MQMAPRRQGECLATAGLLGIPGHGHAARATWVTFAGTYDLGFFMKLVTGQPLPGSEAQYQTLLDVLLPKRKELRDYFPGGSLEACFGSIACSG